MKCISCETAIDPKWKHAIDINVCPFCGKHIMEEHLKNCVAALATAMDEMLKYPEQLDDWLLSNHSYIKTDSPKLVDYLPEEIMQALYKKPETRGTDDPAEPKVSVVKIKMPGGGTQEVLVEKTQSEEKTNSFFERAEVLKGAGKTSGKAPKATDEPEAPKSVVEKTQNLKKLAQQIRTEVSQGLTNESGLAVMMRPDMIDQADPDAVAEFQAAIGSGDIIASGLPPAMDGGDDDESSMHNRVLANNIRMAQKKGGVNAQQEKDMQTLQEMQNKVANAQKRMGSGGFSRSS